MNDAIETMLGVGLILLLYKIGGGDVTELISRIGQVVTTVINLTMGV